MHYDRRPPNPRSDMNPYPERVREYHAGIRQYPDSRVLCIPRPQDIHSNCYMYLSYRSSNLRSKTPTMESPKFKVVIVGGSVSGLTLANMLEKLNIDYVVLEGYKTIAPQVGASIGLQASGLRILDQIGCADTLLDLVDTPLSSQFIRDSEGKEIAKFEGLAKILEHRYEQDAIREAEQWLFCKVE